jgi:hypothetical protein
LEVTPVGYVLLLSTIAKNRSVKPVDTSGLDGVEKLMPLGFRAWASCEENDSKNLDCLPLTESLEQFNCFVERQIVVSPKVIYQVIFVEFALAAFRASLHGFLLSP